MGRLLARHLVAAMCIGDVRRWRWQVDGRWILLLLLDHSCCPLLLQRLSP